NDNKLGGHQVTLVTADEGETAEAARAAAEKLIKQEKVLALTGVVSNQSMLAMKDLVETSQIPLVGSNASPTNLGGVYIWRTAFVPGEPSEALGRWVAEHNDGTIAVVAADSPGDKEEVKAFLDAFGAAGGKPAGAPRYTPAAAKEFGPT